MRTLTMRSFWLGVGIVLGTVLTGGAVYTFRGILPVVLSATISQIHKGVAAGPSESTEEKRQKILKELPFANRQDFDFAARGFIVTREDPKIRDNNGKVVFDLSSYDFLKGEAPASVNPSLWRQAQLITRSGLFKVHERIYQVRGFDISTVSFILTDRGYIVVDPLMNVESARAAFDLLKQHVGDRPVVAQSLSKKSPGALIRRRLSAGRKGESMKTPITQNLIAPCGMNCGICKAYLRAHNPCHGCNEAQKNKPKTRVNCRLRVCEKRTGKFCCDCSDFPCDRLRQLDHRYQTKYGMSQIENLECIRDSGIRRFVASERRRWISEQGIFCVHDKEYYEE